MYMCVYIYIYIFIYCDPGARGFPGQRVPPWRDRALFLEASFVSRFRTAFWCTWDSAWTTFCLPWGSLDGRNATSKGATGPPVNNITKTC